MNKSQKTSFKLVSMQNERNLIKAIQQNKTKEKTNFQKKSIKEEKQYITNKINHQLYLKRNCKDEYILALALAKNAHHDKKQHFQFSSKKFQQTLDSVFQDNEKALPHLQSMKSLIQVKGNGYDKINDINSNIGQLHSILVDDQSTDDTNYAREKARIERAIQDELQQILNLKTRRQLLRDKIVALKAEREKIENIYQTDKAAYKERVTKQSELLRVLDELIRQAQLGLVENPIVPGIENANVEEILAQVKQVGKGHPIEALVALTKIFTKKDAGEIIQRFQALQSAIGESLRIDTEKEDHNLELYATLTHNIDNVLIPQAEAEITQINTEIKQHKARIIELQQELERITRVYIQRRDERRNALQYTNDASTELQSEITRLTKIGANVQ